MKRKLAVLGLVAGLGALGAAGSASAAGTGVLTVAKTSNLVDQEHVKAQFTSGFDASGTNQLTQCRKNDADPTFAYLTDCDLGSEVTASVNAVSGKYEGDFIVFVGMQPNAFGALNDPGFWACAPTDDPTAYGASPHYSTCYIRGVSGGESSTAPTKNAFVPITFKSLAPTTGTPESPLTVALPVAGAAAAAAGFMVLRRRKSTSIA